MALRRNKARVQLCDPQMQHQGKYNSDSVKRAEPGQTDNLARSFDSASTVYIFPIEIDDDVYGGPAHPGRKTTGPSKQPLSTTGHGTSGAPQSELRTEAGPLSSTSGLGGLGVRFEPMEDDDPSDSLLLEVPLVKRRSEDHKRAPRSQSHLAVEQDKPQEPNKLSQSWPSSTVDDQDCTTQSQSPPVTQGKPHQPSKSWHDWIVELFAGRKPSSNASSDKTKTYSTACSSVSDDQGSLPSMTSNEDDAKPTTPQQPSRLPLSLVIPSVRVPTPPRIAHRLRYVDILPAPMTAYTGYAAVVPDVFEPQIVERGFKGPTAGQPVTASAPRLKDPNASLLERNGSTWRVWNQQLENAEVLPFARTPPYMRGRYGDKPARTV